MHERRLFLASCVALVATAMTFAVRGDIMMGLGIEFQLDDTQLGWITGAAFWGFFLSIVIGGPMCDALGMGRIMGLAFSCHAGGILITIFAPGFWVLFAGTLIIGLGNGLVEAAINPLIATLYPNDKTHKLNVLHAWFPGGIVIGGLGAYLITKAMGLDISPEATSLVYLESLSWKIKMAIILVPTVLYGLLFATVKCPQTERVASGVSTGEMFREALRPLFLLWMFCMLLTASTELGPNQWIPKMMKQMAGFEGILVLVWINGLMCIMRFFAGPLAHRLSPIGLLIGSAMFSVGGLLALSTVHSAVPAFIAATIFAIGVCYYWPTMLGVTSERFPKGGALLMGMMGGAGNLSVALVLPLMGSVNEKQGPEAALRMVAVLPVILIFIFAAIYLRDRAMGGYKAVKLNANDSNGAADGTAEG